MSHVLVARLICSDPACAAEAEEHAATVEELETLVCECGCGLEVLALSEAELLEAPQVAGEAYVLLAA